MAEPIVIGFGLVTKATITATAAIQWATNRTGGGVQQSITVRVIFFVKIKGFDEFVILSPFLINFSARPHRDR